MNLGHEPGHVTGHMTGAASGPSRQALRPSADRLLVAANHVPPRGAVPPRSTWPKRGTAMLQLVPNLQRLGTETAFEVLARAAELQRQGKDVINLGIGQPDFKTPGHIVEAAIKALRDGHHGYTPAQGILPLREAVSADLARRHGVEVDPGNVVIMPGGKPTMFFAVLMFSAPGKEIMYPDPGFPIYRSMIEYSGAKPVPIALLESNSFAFSAEAVLAQIKPNTSLIILNSPGNPTGGAVPAEEVKKLVAGLAKHPNVAIM